MSFTTNVKALARTAGLWTKNHAPELLLTGGTVSFVATIVTASRATIKAQEILEEHQEAMRDIKIAQATANEEVYSEQDIRKDTIVVYSKTSIALAKKYALPLGCAALSLTCFFASYGIMKKRYVALGAAYTALNESFNLYRQRVIEDKGKEADMYYLTGVKASQITEKDPETGEKIKKTVIKDLNGNEIIASPYMFKFSKYKENGERNNQWGTSDALNRAFILGQVDYLNDSLYLRSEKNRKGEVTRRGSVFLNELREYLGEDPTTAGSVVGWRFSNGEPGCNGFIDVNMVEGREIDPETGDELTCYYLNPNVDGLIYDLVEKREENPFVPLFGPDLE